MYIEQLDSSRLLISLENDDATVLGGSLDTTDKDPDSHGRLFLGLLKLAAADTGISLINKRLMITLLHGVDVVFIIVTVTPQRRLTKGAKTILMFSPFCTYDLVTAAKNSTSFINNAIDDSSLYLIENRHYLAIYPSENDTTMIAAFFSGYGNVFSITERELLHYTEFGRTLADHNAIIQLKAEKTTSP